MSSQSNPNPNFSEEGARARAAEGAFSDVPENPPRGRGGPQRPTAHRRNNPIAHHRGQEHEVHGGRTAARQQATTDSSRGRGRTPNLNMAGASVWAQEVLGPDYGVPGEHPDAIAARLDPRKATPLPADHPEVRKEIKFDRIEELMQPGTNYDDRDRLLDDNDDWIS